AVGERVEMNALLDALGIVPAQRVLARSLLGWLAHAGVFRRVDAPGTASEELELLRVPDASDPDEMERALAAQYPGFDVETALVVRCGSRLADVLNGTADALRDILFADGGEELTRYYREAVCCRYYHMGVA